MIKTLQLDPNGLCNSGCWYCPVAYEPNPKFAKKNMPIETMRSILTQVKEGIGDFIDPAFRFVYTAHYNEVLLYKHFKEMLDLFREFNFKTMVLTNGTPLTKDKTDTIKEYLDVVELINFNIPSANPATWAKMVGMPETMHAKLMENVRYSVENLPPYMLSIQVNGIDEQSLPSNGGWMQPLENAPILNLDPESGDLKEAVTDFTRLFPGIKVFTNSALVDRAGYLDKHRVMTNAPSIDTFTKKGKTKVIGCGNMGSRTEEWLHINANGDVIICCNDYDFETIFGNVATSSLKEIWNSDARREMITKSYGSLCTTCSHAIWGD